jgi:small subunit ribosomal protein S8
VDGAMATCVTSACAGFVSVSILKKVISPAYAVHPGKYKIMDPIANMLTSVMNAQRVGKKRVMVPFSTFKKDLLEFMQSKSMIGSVRVQEGPIQKLIVSLSYDENEKPVLKGANRLSKPGARYYADAKSLPYKYQGVGTVIVSTSKGLMDEKQARKAKLGGEIICVIW